MPSFVIHRFFDLAAWGLAPTIERLALVMYFFLASDVVPADLRTAIATEQLALATWVLVFVGVVTLIAATAAAGAAFATYRLEARPGLSFTQLVVPPETPKGGYARIYVIDHDGRGHLAIREPGRDDNLNGLVREHLEVRNFSRSAAVAVEIHVRARTKEIDITVDLNDPDLVRDVFGIGSLTIAAIAPDTSTVVPIFGPSSGWELTVDDVTASRPAYGRGTRKKQQVQFVAARLIGPSLL